MRRVGGEAVQLDRQVVVGAAFDQRRTVDDSGSGLGGVLDELVADLDLGDTEVTGARGVGVADGSDTVGDGIDDTGGALAPSPVWYGNGSAGFSVHTSGAAWKR